MNLLWFLPVLAFCGVLFFIITMKNGNASAEGRRTSARVSPVLQYRFSAVLAICLWGALIALFARENIIEQERRTDPIQLIGLSLVAIVWTINVLALRRKVVDHEDVPSRQRNERFFWHGVLILLPVSVLSIAGILSVRWDRADAKEEAKIAARRAAAELSSYLSKQNFTSYSHFKELWENALRDEAEGKKTNWSGGTSPYPAALFDEKQALSRMRFDLQGNLKDPAPIPLPIPSVWRDELTTDQRTLWNEAENAAFVRKDLQGAATILARLQEMKLPMAVMENITFRSLQFRTKTLEGSDAVAQAWMAASFSEEARSEAGLPLRDLQLIRALRALPGNGIPTNVIRALAPRINGDNRSLLASELMREAERAAGSDTRSQTPVRAMQRLWQAEQDTVLLADDLLAAHPVRSWEETGYWVSGRGTLGRYLVILQRETNSSAVLPNGGWIAHNYPEATVQLTLLRTLSQSGIVVPAYCRAIADVRGVRIPLNGNGERVTDKAEVLAESEVQDAERIGQPAPPIRVQLVLAEPEILYARQKQRATWAVALISCAALAAVMGFVSAHRAFRRQLRLADMKDDFVSSVSHELRAPLASVRLLAESLEREKVTDPTKQKEYFKLIGQECRRLSSLVENVLDFSRIEQGRKQYEFEPLDLHRLLEETTKSMQPYAAEKSVGLCLRNDVARDTQPAWDARAIQQALINLIDNAIKHSPAGHSVTVQAQSIDLFIIRLSVTDRGPGIPKEEQGKIFEKFYRLGSELRRETQGIGIGLSIVKHIVEAHNGRVLVESEPGQGSTFTIDLPTKNV